MTKQHSLKLDVYQSRKLARLTERAELKKGQPLTAKEKRLIRESFIDRIKGVKRQNENLRRDIERDCAKLSNFWGVGEEI